MALVENSKNILAPNARIQMPWIKVTIGNYTFGIFTKTAKNTKGDEGQYLTTYNVQYPNFVKSLSIKKVNGQVNQYTLSLSYPVKQNDDPNFFEKVFSSVSKTRKIVFSYGDMSMPSYIYKDEEALITSVKSNFQLPTAVINYTVEAVSTGALNQASNHTFLGGYKRPSDLIKNLVLYDTSSRGVHSLFPGITASNIDQLIDSDDKFVYLVTKTNISTIDYINYLVSCMIPANSTTNDRANTELYVLSFHDDTTYDRIYDNDFKTNGAYLKVKKVSHKVERSDALVIDIGFGNTGTIVRKFNVSDNEGYALMYDYNESLETESYTQKINSQGQWENVYAPTTTSKNNRYMTRAEDLRWWTKVTKYPITATIELQGLLRAASLMSYVRLNVIFPSGHKHIASGLYLITSQTDLINEQGYSTTLGLTKISSDADGPVFNE